MQNYTEIFENFDDLHARLVSCDVGFPDRTSSLTVSLYPWWIHPLSIQATEQNLRHSIDAPDDASKEVTVYARGLVACKLYRCQWVDSWHFTTEHPLLWEFQQKSSIICNAPMTFEEWMQIELAVKSRLKGYAHSADLSKFGCVSQVYRYGMNQSFALGAFPRQVYLELRRELQSRGIPFFAPHEPSEPSKLVVFHGDFGYMIAEDFDVDVPEFEHRPEWFHLAHS